MSLAEVFREVESKVRVSTQHRKEQAYFDYSLAELIGRSVARIYSSNAQMPSITEYYSFYSTDGEQKEDSRQENADKISAIRFKLFAEAHNKKFLKEVAN